MVEEAFRAAVADAVGADDDRRRRPNAPRTGRVWTVLLRRRRRAIEAVVGWGAAVVAVLVATGAIRLRRVAGTGFPATIGLAVFFGLGEGGSSVGAFFSPLALP